jgi:hypothetical protein
MPLVLRPTIFRLLLALAILCLASLAPAAQAQNGSAFISQSVPTYMRQSARSRISVGASNSMRLRGEKWRRDG